LIEFRSFRRQGKVTARDAKREVSGVNRGLSIVADRYHVLSLWLTQSPKTARSPFLYLRLGKANMSTTLTVSRIPLTNECIIRQSRLTFASFAARFVIISEKLRRRAIWSESQIRNGSAE